MCCDIRRNSRADVQVKAGGWTRRSLFEASIGWLGRKGDRSPESEGRAVDLKELPASGHAD
jgi:hypothetical protein